MLDIKGFVGFIPTYLTDRSPKLKIAVLLKTTPDTEADIAVDGDKLNFGSSKFIINPYDTYAVEQALQIKEAGKADEVVLISVCEPSKKDVIVKGLAMGADRAIMIDAGDFQAADGLGVSQLLAAAIKKEEPSLVLCGKQAIDDDNMHIMSMVAEILKWPHINVVTKMDIDGTKVNAEREVEGGQVEVYECNLPLVAGAHKSLNTPRFTSLPNILKAKKKPIEQLSTSDLGVDLGSYQHSKVVSYEQPAAKPPGKVFKDESMEEMVSKVVQLLRDEAKVI